MNKQSLIGLVLIFAIFAGYMWWVRPSDEEIAAMQARHDSIIAAQQDSLIRAAVQDSLQRALTAQAEQGDSSAIAQLGAAKRVDMGMFNASQTGQSREITVSNERMTIVFNTLGGAISKVTLHDYVTYDSMPLEIVTPSQDNLNLTLPTTNHRTAQTKLLTFVPYIDNQRQDELSTVSVSKDSTVIAFRAFAAPEGFEPTGDKYIEFAYTIRANSYEVGFDINYHNLEDAVQHNPVVDLEWNNSMNRQEKVASNARGSRNRNKDPERYYTNLYFKPVKDNVDNLRTGQDGDKDVKTSIEWIAYKQQFFCAILMTDSVPFENASMRTTTKKSDRSNYLIDMQSSITLPYEGGNSSMSMGFYFGPTKYRDLRAMHRHFEKMLPLGMWIFSRFVSRYVILPVFNFLERFNWNYGIIIIVLTVLMRLVLFPLTFKSYQSSAIMRILKPEMDALNKKYPNPEQAMQKQQAMAQLQKRAGMNPMAGCLPMLIQFPILTAMFWFYPVAIELRQQPFLWCDDLSTFDSILNFGFNIPLYGDHISLFCLLMFGMQFFYTWYTMRGQSSQMNMPGMKFMMYFMPFFMLFLFNNQSAALNLYYFCSLSITMLQMVLIRKYTSESRVRARMAAYDSQNKNKPRRQSRFQQQMERLQKMNEELERQRRNQNK